MSSMKTELWTCADCGAQVATFATAFDPTERPSAPKRAARLWAKALLIGGDGRAMAEPRFCPFCGAKAVEG